jgi:hypothetical protein
VSPIRERERGVGWAPEPVLILYKYVVWMISVTIRSRK